MTQFSELGLAEPILRAISSQGYATPTPIQSKVIPATLAGNDILGIAQTGTGKTASFVLPMLDQIERNTGRPQHKACHGLILAPTRELVAQIAENIRNYSKYMRLFVTVIVGGVRPGPQVKKLAGGTDIIVATPGRLLDHVRSGAVRLDQTKFVVLDEADHMLDLGFIPDIRRIMQQLPKKRQTSLLSATMPPQIKALAKDFQNNPSEIAVAAVSRPVERIAQSVKYTQGPNKREILTKILSDSDVDRAIVFTRTKRGADKVSQHLQKAGLAAAAIHGNKSQSQRVKALAEFKSGQTNIMVATDIAARGIDIDDVSHVINYELPEVAEAYVHRIGRTARAGRDGVAISLCDPAEAKLLREIEKLIGSKLDAEGKAPTAAEEAAAKPIRANRQSRGQSQGARTSNGQRGKKAGARTGANNPRKNNRRSSWSPDLHGELETSNRNDEKQDKASGSWRGKGKTGGKPDGKARRRPSGQRSRSGNRSNRFAASA